MNEQEQQMLAQLKDIHPPSEVAGLAAGLGLVGTDHPGRRLYHQCGSLVAPSAAV